MNDVQINADGQLEYAEHVGDEIDWHDLGDALDADLGKLPDELFDEAERLIEEYRSESWDEAEHQRWEFFNAKGF